MKARDLKPGDVIATEDWQGWTVVSVSMGTAADMDNKAFFGVVLLELERTVRTNIKDGKTYRHMWEETETRRTWMRADETIEIGGAND